MNCVFEKTEIINGKTATFLFIKSFDEKERVSKVRSVLADSSWVSGFSEPLRLSYNKRIESTLSSFDNNIKKYNNVMLFRYGFAEEEIELIKPCIKSIDESEILFNDKVYNLPDDIKEKCLFCKY